MGGMENLVKLKVNLKNWSFHVAPAFKLDENDAKELIAEIEKLERERKENEVKNA